MNTAQLSDAFCSTDLEVLRVEVRFHAIKTDADPGLFEFECPYEKKRNRKPVVHTHGAHSGLTVDSYGIRRSHCTADELRHRDLYLIPCPEDAARLSQNNL